MEFYNLHLYLLWSMILLLLVSAKNEPTTNSDSKHKISINVGLILDFNSSSGFVANSCISMALSDFYFKNPHYTTRLVLHPKNSNDVLTAASAALELVNHDQVDAIIGPQGSNEAGIVGEIGGKSQVPIISFSVTSLSLWPSRTPYFIQTTPPDSSQLEAITSLVREYGWSEIVVIYQEESGSDFIPSLTDALQQARIQLRYVIAISSAAKESYIEKELRNLKSMQTRVFLVHVTSPQLASRLFSLAKKVGMMSKGTAWIITDALSNSLSSLDISTIESMEGVIGIRPYIPKSENKENFRIRWNTFMLTQQSDYSGKLTSDFNMFCLRTYDSVWALAKAAEKTQFPIEKRSNENFIASSPAITNLRLSEAGPRLLDEISETKFLGLSGEFRLKHGRIQTSVFELINIVGNGDNGDRTVGYWTTEKGFSQKIVNAAEDHGVVHSKPVNQILKTIIWPGDTTDKPKGWDVPGMGLKLRVGVPKKSGFTEFVNVTEIGHTKTYEVTGFSIDVFKAALESLSSTFRLDAEYLPFVNDSGDSNGTYDDIVNMLKVTENPIYDVLVGDITIRADREEAVDFSLPYSESGVVKVVRAEPDKLKNMWIFLKPLSWDLWLTIVLATIFIGVMFRMLERRVNPQRRLGMLFLFPLSALAFPERKMVGNNWARFVLVIWLFMAYILMQSYTANLSSILTVGQLRPSADIPSCIGFQEKSFVEDMLKKMNIPVRRAYSTMEDYDEALSKGCKNGGVDAIFDEIPYINLFLHKYGSKYKKAGTTYSTGGFGFAFPLGSPLCKPISKAILKIMEKGNINDIKERYFGAGYTSNYEAEDISRDSPSLTSYSFAGLFTVTGILTLLALICSECSFAISRYRDRNKTNIARVHSIEMTHDVAPENDQQNSNEDDEISSEEENDEQQEATHTHIHTNHDNANGNG